MGTPQFFEIPSTGTYRLTDGTAAYQFTEGDMIPMSLAIALGIEGAAYDAVPVFDAAQVAAIEALVAEGGGGGGGGGAPTFPMDEAVWYDNSTAMAGLQTGSGMGMGPDMVYAGLIRVLESDVSITAIGVRVSSGIPGGTTLRLALYEKADTGGALGLPGAKVGDLGTIAVGDYESGWLTASTDLSVEPTEYWMCVSTADSIELISWSPEMFGGPLLGIMNPAGGQYESIGGIEAGSTGAHTAMPSTLIGEVALSDRVKEAPHVFFQITHD